MAGQNLANVNVNVLWRFHNGSVAEKVKNHARSLTNVDLYVERVPHADPQNTNGTGEWAITTIEKLNIWDISKLDACLNMAMQWALADELAKHAPHNPMLQIYHIANRKDLAGRRYDVERK